MEKISNARNRAVVRGFVNIHEALAATSALSSESAWETAQEVQVDVVPVPLRARVHRGVIVGAL